MDNIISILRNFGKDIRTRSFFRRDLDNIIIDKSHLTILDFTDVEFISRSVADEICNIIADYPRISIRGMRKDVLKMYKVVANGRNKPRVYPTINANVYNLRTAEEMHEFFASF